MDTITFLDLFAPQQILQTFQVRNFAEFAARFNLSYNSLMS